MASTTSTPITSSSTISIALVVMLLGGIITFAVSSAQKDTIFQQHVMDDRDPHGTIERMEKRLISIEDKLDSLIEDVDELEKNGQ